MKVLMFGWEFPPHISGGLGTACAGLTRALEDERVDVLFAIPKLRGGEKAYKTTFINASTVPILQKNIISTRQRHSTTPASHFHAPAPDYREAGVAISREGQHTLIEVPSFLSAYAIPEELSSPVEQWNYEFAPALKDPESGNLVSGPEAGNVAGQHTTIREIKEPYKFSGTYNGNLLQEVERYATVAAEIARQYTFDVIHAHDWMTFPAGLAARKASHKPLIVHVHATEVDRSGMNPHSAIFALEKEGMEKADKVVTVSYRTRSIAIEHYHIDPRKIEVVHNGLTPRDKPDDRPFVPPIGAPIVTFLGRVTHQKGPMYFVEAARKVHQQFPEVHFVVAGSGDQLPQMIERIAQVRLSGNFHFTGFLHGRDIDRTWAMSSVYVMPSVSEPFGIAPLEAIQAGVPVIVSKQAGVAEVMRHAIKVDFWNTDALADAICSILRFRSLANTLRRNGEEEIKTITWDKAARKLTTLYYELCTTRKRRKKPHRLLPGSSAPPASHAAVF